MSQPEMREEVNRLVLAIAQVLEMEPAQVAKAFEENRAEVSFTFDDDGGRAIGVRIGDRAARLALGEVEELANQQQAEAPPAPEGTA